VNFEDCLPENMNDPYLIPGTDVLRNNLGLIDPSELECSERLHTAGRLVKLMIKPVNGNFDLKHLQRIHYAIFQDVYEWAGSLRSVDIVKGFTQFASAEYLESSAFDIFNRLAMENYLRGFSVKDFAKSAASYFSDVNALHPFREGNGRAQREFFRDLALKAGYIVDWSITNDREMVKASIQGMLGDNRLFEKIFSRAISQKA
jgi:cell filamentation protein